MHPDARGLTLGRLAYILVTTFTLALACTKAASAATRTVRFSKTNRSFIVVPVFIDQAGPYQFLFDTGSGITVVSDAVASQQHLPFLGSTWISGVTDIGHSTRVLMPETSLAGFCVHDLRGVAISRLEIPGLLVRLDGILGEDFLSSFDILIDNKAGEVTLSDAEDLAGSSEINRIRLASRGQASEETQRRRPHMRVSIPSYSPRPLSLTLDSASQAITLLPKTYGSTLPRDAGSTAKTKMTGLRGSLQCVVWYDVAQVGGVAVRNAAITVCPRVVGSTLDSDGVFPTSLFSRIFMKRNLEYIALNPPARQTGVHVGKMTATRAAQGEQ